MGAAGCEAVYHEGTNDESGCGQAGERSELAGGRSSIWDGPGRAASRFANAMRCDTREGAAQKSRDGLRLVLDARRGPGRTAAEFAWGGPEAGGQPDESTGGSAGVVNQWSASWD